jgi:hypothetical protein
MGDRWTEAQELFYYVSERLKRGQKKRSVWD